MDPEFYITLEMAVRIFGSKVAPAAEHGGGACGVDGPVGGPVVGGQSTGHRIIRNGELPAREGNINPPDNNYWIKL